MTSFPPRLQKLIRELSRLPSVGERTAGRLAYHLVTNRTLATDLFKAIQDTVEGVSLCERCFFLAESELCSICQDDTRDEALLCVVEKPIDLIAFERMGEFKGYYHVLHGLWSPLRGKTAENLRLGELLIRLKALNLREVVIATGSTVEGDATALYIARLLAEKGVNATRLAQGMPKGAELEYADDITLARAWNGRSSLRG